MVQIQVEMDRNAKPLTPGQAIAMWKASRFNFLEEFENEPEMLRIGNSVIGTLGNFSTSIGKAKSKKSFNVSSIAAAALKNGTVLNYTASLPENKRKILYVDTEQTPYHCQKVVKRILRLAELPIDREPENFEFLLLRRYIPEERIEIVKQAIYGTDNLGLVVIDGIRDMVENINDPGESTRIISTLMTWTDERQIHIHTVIHQNKGDGNARGHIGTELCNKAEIVLALEKDERDNDITVIRSDKSREKDFESFAFRINEDALPELVEDYLFTENDTYRPRKEKFNPYEDITEQQHREALSATFENQNGYGYGALQDELRESYKNIGLILGQNKVKALITMLKNKRMIVKGNDNKYRYNSNFYY